MKDSLTWKRDSASEQGGASVALSLGSATRLESIADADESVFEQSSIGPGASDSEVETHGEMKQPLKELQNLRKSALLHSMETDPKEKNKKSGIV